MAEIQHTKLQPKLLLFAGPFSAVILFLLIPVENQTLSGEVLVADFSIRATLSIAAWMAFWWITEAMPIWLTALVPLILFPACQIRSLPVVLESYVHPLIFLFFGGFVISIALQKCALDKRFAKTVLGIFGAEPRSLVAGFMLATAALSMWISNTATTIMMLPIALSILNSGNLPKNLSRCLLLAIAYAASIGGMATIIGTPPNAFVASYLHDSGLEIGFVEWMQVGLPTAALFLVICWVYLVFIRFRTDLRESKIETSNDASEINTPLDWAQWTTFMVFFSVASAWVGRRWLAEIEISGRLVFAGLSDAKIAMLGAAAVFVLPVRRTGGGAILSPRDLMGVPWGTLILFGGGLALSGAISGTGADDLIGLWLSRIPSVNTTLLLAIIIAFVVFMTELTSNIATTATLVPVLAASASVFGIELTTIIVATAFSASCAFMLPVATPPNAIVFGSGKIQARDMARTGFALNLIGILLITYVMSEWFSGFAG